MVKNEQAMVHKFWQQVGGWLIEQFPLVEQKRPDQEGRYADGVILRHHAKGKGKSRRAIPLEGKDVYVIQAKKERLGMYLMGQALFSVLLVKQRYRPKSVRGVILCEKNDAALSPLLKRFKIEIHELDGSRRPPR